MPRQPRGDETATEFLEIRLMPEEKQRIRDEAELAGLTMSEFVRRRALGRKVTSHADLKVINELRRLGGLFKHAHVVTGGMLSEETAAVIADIREAIRQICGAPRDREEAHRSA